LLTLRTVRILRTLALSIAAAGIAQADLVDVTAVVTPNGPLFQYDYSISNASADDLFDLDIAVMPGVTIENLSAPAGFETAYDPGLGLVSFLENTATFGPTPLAGFIFDSPVAPAGTTFDANLQNLDTFDISTVSGNTQGPVPTPEPASLTLFASGAAALLFWRKRFPASAPMMSHHSFQERKRINE
jgi:hypothetical protein